MLIASFFVVALNASSTGFFWPLNTNKLGFGILAFGKQFFIIIYKGTKHFGVTLPLRG